MNRDRDTQPDLARLVATWLGACLLVHDGTGWVDLDGLRGDRIGVLRLPICLVTGWNPGGVERPLAVNQAANERLAADLRARGLPFAPALGRAHDGSWEEPGFGVADLDDAGAREVGQRYGQVAVYWVTEREVVVLGCEGDLRVARRRGVRDPA